MTRLSTIAAAVIAAGVLAGCGEQPTQTIPVKDKPEVSAQPAQRPSNVPEAQQQIDKQRADARAERRRVSRDNASAKQVAKAHISAAEWLVEHRADKLTDEQRAQALSKLTGMPFIVGTSPKPGQGALQSSGKMITVRLLSTGKLSRTFRVVGAAVQNPTVKPPKGYKPPKRKFTPPKLTAEQRREAAFERELNQPAKPAARKKPRPKRAVADRAAKKTRDAEPAREEQAEPKRDQSADGALPDRRDAGPDGEKPDGQATSDDS